MEHSNGFEQALLTTPDEATPQAIGAIVRALLWSYNTLIVQGIGVAEWSVMDWY